MKESDGFFILKTVGRIDASNSGQIHEKIMDEIERDKINILMDFSEVTYISSAGLRVLLYASKALKQKGGSFSLCSINDSIGKIFNISGLADLFDIYESVDSGIAAMKEKS